MKPIQNTKKNRSIRPAIMLWAVLISFIAVAGCSHIVEFITPEGPPSDEQLRQGYQQVQLNASGSADVLELIYLPEYEFLSQSRSVVASAGIKKKNDYKRWFRMVAFDEDALTARRKYLFIADERPKRLFVKPWTGVVFDCRLVLPSEILNKPYADENARRIELLKQVLEDFRSDFDQVAADNKELKTSAMMANQAFEALLVKLSDSPASAADLTDSEGLKFSHINLDEGRAGMTIEGNLVSIRVRLGSFVKDF